MVQKGFRACGAGDRFEARSLVCDVMFYIQRPSTCFLHSGPKLDKGNLQHVKVHYFTRAFRRRLQTNLLNVMPLPQWGDFCPGRGRRKSARWRACSEAECAAPGSNLETIPRPRGSARKFTNIVHRVDYYFQSPQDSTNWIR
jgi:hypothetical protein